MLLEDVDARPGSTTSLLRTVIGLYVRRLGGSVSTGTLIALTDDLGIPAPRARTALARVKRKGLLTASTPGQYSLSRAARTMLERGDRRIFHYRQMTHGDPWLLISASIPEARRDLRHLLRSRLAFLGAGSVAPGLWIVPASLDEEIDELLSLLGAVRYVTRFLTTDPRPSGSLAEAAMRWWDLEDLARRHRDFLADSAAIEELPAFAAYVTLIDRWRPIPYIDPGLAPELLPEHWPGHESVRRFASLSERWSGPAWDHVRAVVEATRAPLSGQRT